MDTEFWRQRWADQQIGFHQPAGHPALAAHWSSLNPVAGEHVLVPLAGESRDMAWLATHGHPVTGVECAERAAHDFFAESGLDPAIDESPVRRCSAAPPGAATVTIEVADFFAKPLPSSGYPLFFDRAALIALPEPRRGDYVYSLCQRLAPGARGLLVTLDYPSGAFDGPPFALPDDSVHRLYDHAFTVTKQVECDVLAHSGHLANQGVDWLIERVYRLELGE